MDERVLGDVPSEGSESGRRFGIYRDQDSNVKIRSVTRNVMLFVTAVAAVIAFSILYPVMQYASKNNKNTISSPHFKKTNLTFTKDKRHENVSSNCSTHIFSFGHDCTEQYSSTTTVEFIVPPTQTNTDTPDIRRFDETSSTKTEGRSFEVDSNLDEIKDFKFQRTGRSKRPVVSTPYPYYRHTPIPKTQDFEDQVLSSQETNVFAIPYDLSSFKGPVSTTTRVYFTPPPYVFTPYPNFTDSYAQLTPYRVPQNNSNFVQVMKYLNRNIASERHSIEEHPKVANREKNSMMKVSGTYVMPLDRRRPGEIILSSSSDNIGDTIPYFNGHAYVSDPFTKYRPTNPSDINRLIPIKSSLDTGPRFRKPVTFVPTSSIAVDITQPASYGDKDHRNRHSGSHTVAIFHPPAVVSQKPTRQPTPSPEGSKDKPLSVVLDIYPATVDSEIEPADETSSPAVRERGRLIPKWKPKPTERPKWRPQPHKRPAASDDPAAKNHMIVHLNLFPNSRKPYSFIRRSRPESTTTMDLRTTVLSGGQFVPRTGSGNAESRSLSDNKAELTTRPLNASKEEAAINRDQPEFSALERSIKEEEEITTINDWQIVHNNEENTTKYLLNNEYIATTMEPAVENKEISR